MSKLIVTKPQGMITEPNKAGQFAAGAFAFSENAAIRSFGTVEQVPKLAASSDFSFPAKLAGALYVVTEGPLTVYLGQFYDSFGFPSDSYWQAVCVVSDKSSGTIDNYQLTTPIPLSFAGTNISHSQETGVLLMRGRLIVTGMFASFAIDYYKAPGDTRYTAHGPRFCGVPQPSIYYRSYSGVVPDAEGGVLSANSHMSACAQIKITQPDGYELLSPPSAPYDFANLSTVNAQVPSVWGTFSASSAYPDAGYVHEIMIFRTRSQSVGYNSGTNKYLPVSTGTTFYMSARAPRTAGSLYHSFEDGTMENALGEALVTNTGRGGASAIPFPPVESKTACSFKGHAFYANRVEPAVITILNPYYWGPIYPTYSLAIRSKGIGIRYDSSITANSTAVLSGFPDTTGYVNGLKVYVYRTSDSVLLNPLGNKIISKTATSITIDAAVSYSGSVFTECHDTIEINGTEYSVNVSATNFVDYFVQSNASIGYGTMDITVIGLEPQKSNASIVGVYPSFVPTSGVVFRMRGSQDASIRATHGANYAPVLPEYNQTPKAIVGVRQPNGYAWSENNQPEFCPPSNFAFAGSGVIHKIISTRDCVWFFCSDGLYRLSGTGGSVGDGYDWNLDPVDKNIDIAGPDAAVAHRDMVFALTTRGFVSITSEGVIRELSDGRINSSAARQDSIPNNDFLAMSYNGQSNLPPVVSVDELNDDVLIMFNGNIWAYNTKTDTFCRRRPSLFVNESPTFIVYNKILRSPLFCWAGRTTVAITATDGSYENMVIGFQPIFGAGTNAPHTMKHWQDVTVTFRSPNKFQSLCLLESDALSTSLSRTIPADTTTPLTLAQSQNKCSIGFTVPRNFPAVSNGIVLKFTVYAASGYNSTTKPIAIEAISLNYIDFVDQRPYR